MRCLRTTVFVSRMSRRDLFWRISGGAVRLSFGSGGREGQECVASARLALGRIRWQTFVMGFLSRIFGEPKKQRTIYDDFLEAASPVLVNGYRRIAAARGCAPGPDISDAEIIQIYQTVGTAFQDAARARGELLPAAILNNIVLYFFQKYQMMGKASPEFFAQHVAYEASKYQRDGLREEYRQPLELF